MNDACAHKSFAHHFTIDRSTPITYADSLDLIEVLLLQLGVLSAFRPSEIVRPHSLCLCPQEDHAYFFQNVSKWLTPISRTQRESIRKQVALTETLSARARPPPPGVPRETNPRRATNQHPAPPPSTTIKHRRHHTPPAI